MSAAETRGRIMTDDIRDDLAYVKALAEEGRDTPLVNGVFYVIWGGVMAAAALLAYAQAVGAINLGAHANFSPWVAGFVLGWGLTFHFIRRTGAKPGASTMGNRTASAVWLSVGLFMSLFWGALMVVHDDFAGLGVPPYFLFNLMFPVGFGVYGVAFFATAAAARLPWLYRFAFVSWAFTVLSLVFMAQSEMYLVGAGGFFLCAFVPGVMFMRNEPSEIV